MNDEIVLKLAGLLHQLWKEEKLAQGYHPPKLCPNYECVDEEEEINVNLNDDFIHCNKCLSTLVEFYELSEFQKAKYLKKAEDFYLKLEQSGLELTAI